jgi:hypothetical protein
MALLSAQSQLVNNLIEIDYQINMWMINGDHVLVIKKKILKGKFLKKKQLVIYLYFCIFVVYYVGF